MAMPAQAPVTPAGARPEPVPVAFSAGPPPWRCRTRARRCAGSSAPPGTGCPPGWFIAAITGTSSPAAWTWSTAARATPGSRSPAPDLPRDGGMADLLAEAASPAPRFAAVVCEDIERSGRDMFNALKLEKELSRAGHPAVRHRRARRHRGRQRHHRPGPAGQAGRGGMVPAADRRRRSGKGCVEHSLDGWNIGTRALRLRRRPDPAPGPGQGRPGPHQDPADPRPGPRPGRRADLHLADRGQARLPAIAARLNADPAAYPPPTRAPGGPRRPSGPCCANPKYTGHMVYGRIRTRNGRRASPSPRTSGCGHPSRSHPAIVDRATWDAAQQAGRRPRHQPRRRRAQPHPARADLRPTGPGSGAGTAAAG